MTQTHERLEQLKEKTQDFPSSPGVYLMKNAQNKVLYVGKAKSLKNRVRSYFSESKDVHPKVRFLMSHTAQIDYMLTKTEVEAFLLEATLIKKHRPRYNIRLKDDKSYPYIKVSSDDEFPRLYLARRVKRDGSLYFGPYTSSFSVRETIRFLNATFKIRDCKDAFMKSRKRPCITYEIGRCTAPCVGFIDEKSYRNSLQSATEFLKGENKKVVSRLEGQMKAAAKEERFEHAARLRDSLSAVRAVLEKQAVVSSATNEDVDVFGYFGSEQGCVIESLHVRHGRLIGNRHHILSKLNIVETGEDGREWLTSFLNQYYEENLVPQEVWLPFDLDGDLNKLLAQVLFERSGIKARVCFPTGPEAKSLLELARTNAEQHFKEHKEKIDRLKEALVEIKERLGLSDIPKRMECFDISNFQGGSSVASQVVFEEGVPAPDQYRRYRIKTVQGANDYASIKEVISRRFAHTEWDDPSLILIDGGKGQLRMAREALREIGRKEVPVFSIAKARTSADFEKDELERSEERIFAVDRQNHIPFRQNSPALQIFVQMRDEAHRFAITYHRDLREKKGLESALDQIVGVGPQRRQKLLTHFGSIEDLVNASPESIASVVPGLSANAISQIRSLDPGTRSAPLKTDPDAE